jgi:hypothetical protein
MKQVLMLALAAFYPFLALATGGSRDGGDEGVNVPLYTCENAAKTLTVLVEFNDRDVTVKDAAGNSRKFEKTFPQVIPLHTFDMVKYHGLSKVYRAYQMPGPTSDLALVIFLEKRVTGTEDQYEARVSTRVGGKLFRAVDLTCKYFYPSIVQDPTESYLFDK